MIIDATGPRVSSRKEIELTDVIGVKEIRDASFPYRGSPALCVIRPEPEVKGLGWVFKEEALSGCRMVVCVDDDIDIHDGRQILWAMATRFQPAEDSVIKDNRLVIDARRGDSWTALRVTLPFERVTYVHAHQYLT